MHALAEYLSVTVWPKPFQTLEQLATLKVAEDNSSCFVLFSKQRDIQSVINYDQYSKTTELNGH